MSTKHATDYEDKDGNKGTGTITIDDSTVSGKTSQQIKDMIGTGEIEVSGGSVYYKEPGFVNTVTDPNAKRAGLPVGTFKPDDGVTAGAPTKITDVKKPAKK